MKLGSIVNISIRVLREKINSQMTKVLAKIEIKKIITNSTRKKHASPNSNCSRISRLFNAEESFISSEILFSYIVWIIYTIIAQIVMRLDIIWYADLISFSQFILPVKTGFNFMLSEFSILEYSLEKTDCSFLDARRSRLHSLGLSKDSCESASIPTLLFSFNNIMLWSFIKLYYN